MTDYAVELDFIPEGHSEPDRIVLRAQPYEDEDMLVDRAIDTGWELGEPIEVRRGTYGPSLWLGSRW